MKKFLRLALASLAVLSFSAHADGKLNSYFSTNIDAPASRIWDIVKDYDGLDVWHPVFSGADIKSGTNNEVGAVRTLTIKDGPSFDEELLAWDGYNRTFTYRVIDPAPIPVKNYRSTMTVMQLEPGVSNVTWRSSYQNNSNGEMSDVEVIDFLNGVYKAGLEQVRGMVR
ncbi:MAG: SRPBCC family protein [Betaproteobacteria bacterium]|jgi:mxaD protein|nr:MAG: SRPBCC family protein [Betaproteobacteria bacterium]